MQRGEPHSNFVLIALVFWFERLVDVGIGIVDRRHGDLAFRGNAGHANTAGDSEWR
mgnify:CR=1 FL=1